MVCNRCIMVVRNELEKIGYKPLSVTLGEVELGQEINETDKQKINAHLQTFGFELIDDKKAGS